MYASHIIPMIASQKYVEIALSRCDQLVNEVYHRLFGDLALMGCIQVI